MAEPLTGRQLLAWRATIRAHAVLVEMLGAELEEATGMGLGPYEVLAHLTEAEGARLRMSELADRVVLSRSGLTRLVDRMVADGLVRREGCAEDRRGAYAVVTPAGRRALEQAWPVHVEGVRRHFVDVLTPAELDAVAEGLGRVAAARPPQRPPRAAPGDRRGAAVGPPAR